MPHLLFCYWSLCGDSVVLIHDRRYCVIQAAFFVHFLCFDLVKTLLLGDKEIGDTESEKLAETFPNMINLTETRPDS